ncbi:amino acid adenylation domain-containing protein [Micromonospora echinaurantiaca]|uniref:amino acid adenylation domain-containing protein n=1 Tax=Micromonospora echinaurantiaca TaxID=47857 RepID=UPI00378745D0
MDSHSTLPATGTPLTADRMRADIAELVGGETALDEAGGDLIAVGLDSMKVMRLAARWRAAGVDVKFADLFARPTFAQWQDLIAQRQSAPAEPAAKAAPAHVEVDESAPFPLATMQHAYWVGRAENLTLGGVATHFYAELDGAAVDPRRLETAARALLRRHGMLRARVLGDGRQQIQPEPSWRGLTVHDLRELPPARVEAELARLRDALSHRRFDVAGGEVFDVGVSLLPAGRTRLHLNIDMLVADALSFRIIINDLAALYADPAAELPAIGYSYPRYLADRRARPVPGRADAERYWADRLPELPRAPRLPLAVAPEQLTRHRVTRRHHWLSADRWARLAERARDQGVTLSMTFAAAFSEVLAGWSEEPDFLLNVPLFDREPIHPDVGLLVGDFSNLLILGVHTAPGGSFLDLVRRTQARFTADAAHSAYSGLEVLRELARRDGAAQTLAPVVFTSALGLGELFNRTVTEHFGTLGWNISQAPQVVLDHQVTEHAGGLLLNWDAVDELFCDGVLDAMFDAYLRLLDWLATERDWSAPTPSLLPADQAARRAAVNRTAGPERERRLHESFYRHAADQPDRVALVAGDGTTVSYRALAERADRIAGLLAGRGCRPGEPVAVTLPRGPDQVAAVLGVLRAGGAFVPVGAGQPADRRAAIHADAGIRLVLTDAATRGALAWPAGTAALTVEEAVTAEPLSPAVEVDPEELAYVIYTSGSTGTPKGVEMSHRAAANTIEDIGDRWWVGADDRGFAVTSLEHDWSVYELFAYLSAGGALVLPPEEARRDAQRWADLVDRHGVTVWTGVPALLDMLLTTARPGQLRSLRLALLGGDWVGLDLRDRLITHAPGCRLVALGGATEVGIHSTWHEVTEVPAHWRSVPYGAPLRNQRVRVVDARGRDCPDWVPGELWLGGVGVGRGYRGDPARTAERFVEHDGGRWYRTGDLCRYHPDGTLELLGRTDFQVKLLGQRIDLGEVEAAARSYPGVARTVALVVTEPRRLALAVVPADADLAVDDLVAHLRRRLPEHMVPRQVDLLTALPLNANGKVDRSAIAGLLANRPTPQQTEPPRGETETRVAAIWAQLLENPAVGRSDSFFTLGGNSLLATRVIAALRQAGYADASLTQLFATPTLAEFARHLTPGGPAPLDGVAVRADAEHRHEPFDATEVQRAYWLGRRPEFTLGGVGSHWYWEFEGRDVDLDRLAAAWNRLVDRHEMLRAVFDDDGRQRVLPEVPPVRIRVTDAGADPAPLVAAMRAELAHHVFATDSWPLFDLRAVRSADGVTRLGVSLDFAVLDALSIMIVFSELSRLYADPAAVLPPIGVSFRDVLLADPVDPARRAAARDHWLKRIDELPSAPQLPLARDPAQLSGHRFSRRECRLDADDWRRLSDRAARHGVTGSTVVATAFAAVLRAWSAAEEFTLNFTLFDRPEVHPDIHRVVGDFTSLLLVADRPEPGESFAAAARRLQRQVWSDMEHSAYSGISVLRELARRTGAPEVLMPVVFTSTLGVRDATEHRFDLRTPFGEYRTGLSQTPQVLLDHQVTEHDGGLLLNWDAVDEAFCPGVLDAMFAAYRDLLVRLAGAADWDAPARVPLPDAQAAVRRRVNDTAGPRSGRLLHEGFLAVAAARPDAPALAWGDDGVLGYGELADRAGRVAAALRAAGVRPGDRVAVTLPKGPGQVVAVLGVLAAGAAYVPVGVDHPALRRDRIVADSGARAVLDAAFLDRAGEHAPAEPVTVPPHQPAYVIYTSGSTGDPKGVVISHASAVNTVEDVNQRYAVGPADRVLAVSALDFDLSVYDVFGLLAAGGTVVLPAEEERRDPAAWLRLARTHRVTLWNSVPALLDMLLTEAGGDLPAALRLALVSGDWVGLDLPGRLAAAGAGRCRLVALGGATEAAIWSNAFEVTEVPPGWTSIPYGFPLRNQCYRVVDGPGGDRPDWVPGELWIGGAGVALGYHRDPERTAARFVEYAGERWYRTGDLGRYWPDGTLEFLGRVDHQVKVRGHRIELGEIETALESHPAVTAAIACAVGERTRRLAAAVTTVGQVDPDDLRAHLAARLPDYMVPRQLAVLPRLPLSPNGKVDRAAVGAALAGAAGVAVAEPPRGPTEEGVAGLWRGLLDLPVVDRDASFFAAGGDSLLATRLVQLIRQRFGVQMSLREVLSAPSVAGQARVVAARLDQAGATFEEGVL